MTAFLGHAADSTAKAIYNDPTIAAPADRLWAPDGDSNGKPDVYAENIGTYASTPGAAARANGYPQAT